MQMQKGLHPWVLLLAGVTPGERERGPEAGDDADTLKHSPNQRDKLKLE